MRIPTVAEIVSLLDEQYDPAWAQSWDAVGLVCGEPDAGVSRVLFAVDPVEAVAAEAADWGADLLVTHHPLFLRGTSSVAATTPKGRLVHRLVGGRVALHVAHTNADVAKPGVSDALAAVLGVVDLAPLVPAGAESDERYVKIVTFVPHEAVDQVVEALAAAGAGRTGDYSRAAWFGRGTGTFRPEPGAEPAIGSVGHIELVPETRLEMIAPRGRRAEVVRALLAAHPYEEPAHDVIELAALPTGRGLGRVGELARPCTLADFAERVAAALPSTVQGVRVAGDPEAAIRRVAVVGGAGDDAFDAVARSGADAYVTADLRHHPASEERAHERVALLDVAHWASEWPWLPQAARRLVEALEQRGATVNTRVSGIVTDPWTALAHAGTPQTAHR